MHRRIALAALAAALAVTTAACSNPTAPTQPAAEANMGLLVGSSS